MFPRIRTAALGRTYTAGRAPTAAPGTRRRAWVRSREPARPTASKVRTCWKTREQNAYDPSDKIIYSVGSNIIHVIDASDPQSLTELYHVSNGNVDITDIEFCGGFVMITEDNLDDREHGSVVIYEKYSRCANTLKEVKRIGVGALPDMLKPNRDCSVIVVALEAEGFERDGAIVDPEGGVGIIRFNKYKMKAKYTFANFRKFKFDDDDDSGLRFVYRENGNKFANDLEPEYVTFNDDYSLAYVALQENNGIAVVDIKKRKVTEIIGLGKKKWKDLSLDASNKDGGINFHSWDIYGMYQPDTIEYFHFDGKGYLLTANEGDAKEYEDIWEEEIRGHDIIADDLAGDLGDELLSALEDDAQLGRLKFSRLDGLDENSRIEKLHAYGGRSFSIWDVKDMGLVYDSGNIIEKQMAAQHSLIFNAEGETGKTPQETADSRSDDKGPECESVTLGTINNKQVIFVGNERPGTIALFSFETDPSDTKFESIYSGLEDPATDKTWDQVYDDRTIGDLDPEDLKFIPAIDSPNGEPLLLVAGSVSSRVSLYSIKDTDDDDFN